MFRSPGQDMRQDDKQFFQLYHPLYALSLWNLSYNSQQTSDKKHHPKKKAAFFSA
jgi:hypothetical protein